MHLYFQPDPPGGNHPVNKVVLFYSECIVERFKILCSSILGLAIKVSVHSEIHVLDLGRLVWWPLGI